MLGNRDAMGTLGVRDIKRARAFYQETLGLTPVATEGDQVVVYQAGATKILVYQSQFAGTNQATSLTWEVGSDLEKIVESLRSKGVGFEHYDFPGGTRQGDIHIIGKVRNAWFKDPDGNIHSLVAS